MGNLSSFNINDFHLCCTSPEEDDIVDRNATCGGESVYQRRQRNTKPQTAQMISELKECHDTRDKSYTVRKKASSSFHNTNDKALYRSFKLLPSISMEQDTIRSLSSVSTSSSHSLAASIREQEKRQLEERNWERIQEIDEGRNDIQVERRSESIRGMQDDEIRASASSLYEENTRDRLSSYYASTSRRVVYFDGGDRW